MEKDFTYSLDIKRINKGARAFADRCGAPVAPGTNLMDYADKARTALSEALKGYSPRWDEKGTHLTLTLPDYPSGWWWLRTDLETIMATSLLWASGSPVADRARAVAEAVGEMILKIKN